jgi:predicted peptidase
MLFRFMISTLFLASTVPLLQAQKVEQALEAKTFQDGDFSLNYRIYVPAGLNPADKVPLVLFFHGAGERGVDNIRQLHHGVPSLFSYTQKNKIPAILIVPQCPVGMQWVNVPWGGDSHQMPKDPSKPMHAAMELLAQSIKDFPVDTTRIYVTGISMGGFGTWDILQREPELFAAGLPICGGGDSSEASKLKEIPLRVFHGDQDKTVKTQRSRDMTEAIQKAGGTKIQYTEYPGVAHNSWTQTYANDEVLKWLFEQKKP